MKRIVALLLALIMVMSFATTAFAAEDEPAKNDSITVSGAKAGETYNLYKLFDLSVDSEAEPTAYTYTVNPAWAAFFAATEGETPAGAGRQYVTIDAQGYVTAISDAAALAKAAAEWDGKPATAVQTIEATGDTVVFDGLENGYWLITSTLGTVAMTETTPDKAAVTVNEKNKEDTITKEVKEDSTDEWGENNDAQVGDIVEFKSTITLYPNTRNVKVHDTMDAGLTYNGDAAIAGLTVDTDYTVVSPAEDGHTFDVIFTDAYINSLKEVTTLTLTYTAVLNEGAVVKGENGVAIVDQYNKTSITYGDKQSVEDETKTTTHKFAVNKYATDVENLAGAEFSLKKAGAVVKLIQIDETNYRVAMANEENAVETFTTVASGDIVIWGVDADDDYTLEEITAPAGYNKLAAEVAVTVNAENNTIVDVLNQAGTKLPSTGGMGTTLFYILGGMMMLAAVVLLVTKKRMAAAE